MTPSPIAAKMTGIIKSNSAPEEDKADAEMTLLKNPEGSAVDADAAPTIESSQLTPRKKKIVVKRKVIKKIPGAQNVTPTGTPVATPLATPVATPVATPLATPLATPVETPRKVRGFTPRQAKNIEKIPKEVPSAKDADALSPPAPGKPEEEGGAVIKTQIPPQAPAAAQTPPVSPVPLASAIPQESSPEKEYHMAPKTVEKAKEKKEDGKKAKKKSDATSPEDEAAKAERKAERRVKKKASEEALATQSKLTPVAATQPPVVTMESGGTHAGVGGDGQGGPPTLKVDPGAAPLPSSGVVPEPAPKSAQKKDLPPGNEESKKRGSLKVEKEKVKTSKEAMLNESGSHPSPTLPIGAIGVTKKRKPTPLEYDTLVRATLKSPVNGADDFRDPNYRYSVGGSAYDMRKFRDVEYDPEIIANLVRDEMKLMIDHVSSNDESQDGDIIKTKTSLLPAMSPSVKSDGNEPVVFSMFDDDTPNETPTEGDDPSSQRTSPASSHDVDAGKASREMKRTRSFPSSGHGTAAHVPEIHQVIRVLRPSEISLMIANQRALDASGRVIENVGHNEEEEDPLASPRNQESANRRTEAPRRTEFQRRTEKRNVPHKSALVKPPTPRNAAALDGWTLSLQDTFYAQDAPVKVVVELPSLDTYVGSQKLNLKEVHISYNKDQLKIDRLFLFGSHARQWFELMSAVITVVNADFDSKYFDMEHMFSQMALIEHERSEGGQFILKPYWKLLGERVNCLPDPVQICQAIILKSNLKSPAFSGAIIHMTVLRPEKMYGLMSYVVQAFENYIGTLEAARDGLRAMDLFLYIQYPLEYADRIIAVVIAIIIVHVEYEPQLAIQVILFIRRLLTLNPDEDSINSLTERMAEANSCEALNQAVLNIVEEDTELDKQLQEINDMVHPGFFGLIQQMGMPSLW